MDEFNCIAVLGATASGKTKLACRLADRLNGEIISADSRQVYQFLDIGTGKDLDEYVLGGKKIRYHLINTVPPEEQFYLHQFVEQLQLAFDHIRAQQKVPIICGGTGLYLDALRKEFSLTDVKENEGLRAELAGYSKQQLTARLTQYPLDLIEHVDQSSVKRIIRGIEIAEYHLLHRIRPEKRQLPYKPYYLGIRRSIEQRKQLISKRLVTRLENGLLEEVESLLKRGVPPERLEWLGLEYKFVLHQLQGKISKQELLEKLQTAIFQFAKRQMTWFRKMEKEGVKINWIEEAHREATLEVLAEIFSR